MMMLKDIALQVEISRLKLLLKLSKTFLSLATCLDSLPCPTITVITAMIGHSSLHPWHLTTFPP